MPDDLLRRMFRRFARPDDDASYTRHDLGEVDDLLAGLDRELRDIHARLSLLDRQSNPRGIGCRHD